MQAYPHRYTVQAALAGEGEVQLTSADLPSLASAPPSEFGGPGDRWSPETLLVAAIADCFVLTFKAIARASNFSWSALSCDVEGILDRAEGVTQFTYFTLNAKLSLDRQAPEVGTFDRAREQQRASRLLHKAEQTCLITQSVKANTHLNINVDINC